MILCLNLGSSSLKVSVFADEARPSETNEIVSKTISIGNLSVEAMVQQLAAELEDIRLSGIGHRVVFGGDDFVRPHVVSDAMLAKLEGYIALFPLHLPLEIALMRTAAKAFKDVPQVACFDTAFHATMPAIAKRLPIPRALWQKGFRRYGFHGLSYEYVVERLGDAARGRAIVAHLGNGSSAVALRNGAPLDTTMAFSPLGGLMMGTRPGDLDPGILVSLMRDGYDADALNRLLEEQSGLRGVSETTGDVAALLKMREADSRAAEALDLFAYMVRKHVGALTAVLGGLDLLVFTGGIGEHAAPIREAIVAALPEPRPAVRVIPTNENLVIARHTHAVLGLGNAERECAAMEMNDE